MLRIGTQNLGLDDTVRAATLVDDIFDRYSLDILCLQEVYRKPKVGDGDLIGAIKAGFSTRASLPQMYYHEGGADTWMINLTISRCPIIQPWTITIEDRQLLDTLIATPWGHVRVFNWHAKRDGGGASNACRYNKQALAHMRDVLRPGDTAFLVGDMNQKTDDIMECGGANMLRRNPDSYDLHDFYAYISAPPVLSVVNMGNEYGLQDAHALTVATVTVGKVRRLYMPIIQSL